MHQELVEKDKSLAKLQNTMQVTKEEKQPSISTTKDSPVIETSMVKSPLVIT
jgi:hypothetical protein